MPIYLRSIASLIATVTVLLTSRQLLVGNELLLNLAHRTGIDPGIAISAILVMIGLYFFLDDFLRWSNEKSVRLFKSLWLALQGLKFRSFRSAAILVGSGVVTGSLFMQIFLAIGAMNSIGLAETRMGADLMVLPSDAVVSLQPFYTYPFSLPSSLSEDYVDKIRSIEGVERVAGQYYMGDVVINEGCGVLDKVFLIVVNDHDFVVSSNLNGLWDGYLAPGEVIKGSEVPKRMYLYSVLSFLNFTVKSSMPETGTYLDHVIYISKETASSVMSAVTANPQGPYLMDPEAPLNPFNLKYEEGKVNVIYVKARKGANIDELSSVIERELKGVKVIKIGTLTADTRKRVDALMSILTTMNGGALTVSFVLISFLSFIAVNEQRRELGILRAIGAPRRFVAKLVTTQTAILTLFGGVLGMVVAWMALYASYYDIMRVLKIPFLCPAFLDTLGIVSGVLAFSVAVGVTASLPPSVSVSRSEPLQVIRGSP